MKTKTAVLAGVVAVVAGLAMLQGSGEEFEVECHPWRGDFRGTFQQREGPGAKSSVVFGSGDTAEGVGRSSGAPYRASGTGTWRLTEQNLVEWRLEGVNRLGTGVEVPWRPTYLAESVECDGRGKVTRIIGDGTDTAPFPSRFDFVRTG